MPVGLRAPGIVAIEVHHRAPCRAASSRRTPAPRRSMPAAVELRLDVVARLPSAPASRPAAGRSRPAARRCSQARVRCRTPALRRRPRCAARATGTQWRQHEREQIAASDERDRAGHRASRASYRALVPRHVVAPRRRRCRSGAAARSSAPGRAASPPTARSSRRCAGWRTAPGTSSTGKPIAW